MKDQVEGNVIDDVVEIPVVEPEVIDIPIEPVEEPEGVEIEIEEIHDKNEKEVELMNLVKTTEPKTVKKSDSRKTVSILGMICGVIICIMGLMAMSGSLYDGPAATRGGTDTVSSSYEWYGGDAYTGIQHAGAEASVNAKAAADNIALTNSYLYAMSGLLGKGFGMMLLALGLMTFMKYLYTFVDVKNPAIK